MNNITPNKIDNLPVAKNTVSGSQQEKPKQQV